LGLPVARGLLAGGEQSATQPPALLQLAKIPLDPDEELEEELELVLLVLLVLLELVLLVLVLVMPEVELVELEELVELVLLELVLLDVEPPQLALLTTTLPALNEEPESVE
jgi:hypothetical protein